MKNLEDAILFAVTAHRGQIDKSGIPYILHPLRVMEAVRQAGGNETAQMIAVLHDVIEDCNVTRSRLYQEGFSEAVADGVEILSHDTSKETYEEFIERVKRSGHPEVVTVKRCDIQDNLNRPRPASMEGIEKKYHKALEALKGN